jgi:hypothetical protein
VPKDGKTFDFGDLRDDVNSDADCFNGDEGGLYDADGVTAVTHTGGSFSATDTQFTKAADAIATKGTDTVKICYEQSVAYDVRATLGNGVLYDGDLACTAAVSIINCVFDEDQPLGGIGGVTHNTAFQTRWDLGGLRDSILDTAACWNDNVD